MDAYIRSLNDQAALRESLSPAERQERWPIHPALPLAEWGRRVAKDGVAVNEADLANAIGAFASTPSELPRLGPARQRPGLVSRLGRRRRGSAG